VPARDSENSTTERGKVLGRIPALKRKGNRGFGEFQHRR